MAAMMPYLLILLPETTISVPFRLFVNSIFPVREKALEGEPLLEKIPEYNKALKELCDSQTVAFIDNTDLVSEQYYEQDGIHFKADFYPIWAEHMAEVASL